MSPWISSFLAIISALFLSGTCKSLQHSGNLKTYIVHVHEPSSEHQGTHRDWHQSFLPQTDGTAPRLLYSYSHILNAFAARLTDAELETMKTKNGFLHAEPTSRLSLHTTHTPAFLGLHPIPNGFWSGAAYGKGVIIGLLDTGIAPFHPSFEDEGMPPPPPRWKGTCEFASPLRCNNKLIGARAFIHDDSSSTPYDYNGHGTHTASTAAGRFVANASLLGSASGIAAGMAPDAYVAMYKVCKYDNCDDADILAGMEQAVKDGVDVISMSIGGPPEKFYKNSIAIAAFGAVKKGVFVSASAGNDGPSRGSVANAAPWILTVGASSIDRKIRAVVKLGDGQEFEGQSAYQPGNFPAAELFPFVYPWLEDDANSSYCMNKTSLERFDVKGKVVLCWGGYNTCVEKGEVVKEAGGVAAIPVGDFTSGFETFAEAHVIPASQVSYSDGYSMFFYTNSTDSPKATIVFKGTKIGDESAPAVSAYSSRGPSKISPGILKPDIVGPGSNVLAAWPSAVGPFPVAPPFNMISGTSMACPHLGGIAALLKSSHPDWSPAMIKSAIITTSDTLNLNGEPILDLWNKEHANFYVMGAGHVNPVRAANPGLAYDIPIQDYVAYLCGLGYTEQQVRLITRDEANCATFLEEAKLNYPSFAVSLSNSIDSSLVVYRNVVNVGDRMSSYAVSVVRPKGITVSVAPERLLFSDVWETQSYTVRFGINMTEAAVLDSPWMSEGYLIWVSLNDDGIRVKSPISVTVGSISPMGVDLPYNVTLH